MQGRGRAWHRLQRGLQGVAGWGGRVYVIRGCSDEVPAGPTRMFQLRASYGRQVGSSRSAGRVPVTQAGRQCEAHHVLAVSVMESLNWRLPQESAAQARTTFTVASPCTHYFWQRHPQHQNSSRRATGASLCCRKIILTKHCCAALRCRSHVLHTACDAPLTIVTPNVLPASCTVHRLCLIGGAQHSDHCIAAGWELGAVAGAHDHHAPRQGGTRKIPVGAEERGGAREPFNTQARHVARGKLAARSVQR